MSAGKTDERRRTLKERAHPEPRNVRDSERPSIKSATNARAGRIAGEVRYILTISLTLVVVAFAILYVTFS